MPYADVVELALYHPEHGFYSSGGQAGRRGDFITSPEVGPLFGHLIAHAVDAEWDRQGQPDVFTVVDYGAGPGTLARTVLAAEPRCLSALRYIAVEQSVEQRAKHPEAVLSLDVLPPDLIAEGIVGVVIANELLDNLAFTVLHNVDGVLLPGFVAERDGRLCAHFPPDPSTELMERLSGSGDLVERVAFDQSAAAGFVTWVLGSVLERGRLIVIDYARTRSEDVELRTYAEHGRAGDPLAQLGTKDITVDVDLEQLQAVVGAAGRIMTQAEWLTLHGIDELVEEGRRIWHESAGVGDLAALKARSRVREAEALVEPTGLGGFLVAEWVVDSSKSTTADQPAVV